MKPPATDPEPSPLALTLALSLIATLKSEWGQDVLADLLRAEGWRCKPPPRRRAMN